MIQYKYDLGEVCPGLTVKNRTPQQGPQAAQYLVMQDDGRIRWLSERQVDQLLHFMTSTVALNHVVVGPDTTFKVNDKALGSFSPELINTDPTPVPSKPKRGKK